MLYPIFQGRLRLFLRQVVSLINALLFWMKKECRKTLLVSLHMNPPSYSRIQHKQKTSLLCLVYGKIRPPHQIPIHLARILYPMFRQRRPNHQALCSNLTRSWKKHYQLCLEKYRNPSSEGLSVMLGCCPKIVELLGHLLNQWRFRCVNHIP